ncbi:hypothetical protein SC1_00052 [Sphingopyxis sp. C-1]|nr:hypothetical protein SC1_00052 [Sphingopyxis sp. C-1]
MFARQQNFAICDVTPVPDFLVDTVTCTDLRWIGNQLKTIIL